MAESVPGVLRDSIGISEPKIERKKGTPRVCQGETSHPRIVDVRSFFLLLLVTPTFLTYYQFFFEPIMSTFLPCKKLFTPFDRQSFFDVFEKPSHPHILVLLSLLFFETTPWPTMSLFYTFSTRTISRWWSVRYVDISICEIPGNKKDQHARRHIHIRVHTNSAKFCTRQFFFFCFKSRLWAWRTNWSSLVQCRISISTPAGRSTSDILPPKMLRLPGDGGCWWPTAKRRGCRGMVRRDYVCTVAVLIKSGHSQKNRSGDLQIVEGG